MRGNAHSLSHAEHASHDSQGKSKISGVAKVKPGRKRNLRLPAVVENSESEGGGNNEEREEGPVWMLQSPKVVNPELRHNTL